MAALDVHATKLRLLANAPSTVKSYENAWNIFKSFRKEIKDNTAVPPSEDTLVRFVSYLSLVKKLAPATVKSYVAGVRYHLNVSARPTFNDSFRIRKMLLGCTRSYVSEHQREGLSRQEMEKFLTAMPSVTKNLYLTKMYSSCILLAYYGLVRPGELIGSRHAIRCSRHQSFSK